MQTAPKPQSSLAKKILPKPLLTAIEHVFAQNITDTWLVGGTALAGFYAGHRRSDDIDLFVKNELSFQATVLAVKSLKKIGAEITETMHSNQYFRANCKLSGHLFTTDVVVDSNLFHEGKGYQLESIVISDLDTIFMMKAATLVSRCSEKDLFDLMWLFENLPDKTISDLISSGSKIDSGVHGEALLLSISGTNLSALSCEFSTDPKKTAKMIHSDLLRFQKELLIQVAHHLKEQPALPLKKLVAKARRFL